MSIKITLEHLARAVESQAIAHVSALIPLGGYQFRVAKLLDAVDSEYKGYAKQRNALVTKYGVPHVVEGKTVGTTMTGATPENILAFNDGLSSLLSEETLIPYEPIIYSKLGAEGEKLSINDVRALGSLLIEELPAPAEPLKVV
jgi:hypothetical protein